MLPRLCLNFFTRNNVIDLEDHNEVSPEKYHGPLAFNNVEFTYPYHLNTIILRRFKLRINAGSSATLIGKSRCGKSTIVKFTERFYDLVKGIVLTYGKDLRSFFFQSLRQNIALVGKDQTLFVRSI